MAVDTFCSKQPTRTAFTRYKCALLPCDTSIDLILISTPLVNTNTFKLKTENICHQDTSTDEAGSDPRGHLWVTWGVELCAGKPPLADIILSHPPGLTRCDSVIGLAIPAMSGHIRYRGAASWDLYIKISGINRVFES